MSLQAEFGRAFTVVQRGLTGTETARRALLAAAPGGYARTRSVKVEPARIGMSDVVLSGRLTVPSVLVLRAGVALTIRAGVLRTSTDAPRTR
jgi:hypothetical protein